MCTNLVFFDVLSRYDYIENSSLALRRRKNYIGKTYGFNDSDRLFLHFLNFWVLPLVLVFYVVVSETWSHQWKVPPNFLWFIIQSPYCFALQPIFCIWENVRFLKFFPRYTFFPSKTVKIRPQLTFTFFIAQLINANNNWRNNKKYWVNCGSFYFLQ